MIVQYGSVEDLLPALSGSFIPTSNLPVDCWRRYLSQVFPDPGKEASATLGLGLAKYPTA